MPLVLTTAGFSKVTVMSKAAPPKGGPQGGRLIL